MFTSVLQSWSRAQFRRVAVLFAHTPITPNMLTLTGFLINVLVGLAVAWGNLLLGAALIFVAGVFDLLDGALAKVKNQASPFGAFLDSFVDRYGEAAMLGGLLVYYVRQAPWGACADCADSGRAALHYLWTGDAAVNIVLIFFAMVGSTMISYARARAEALKIDCEIGLLPRTERVVLIALGLLFALPTPVLWVLAIGTHITAVQRLLFVWEVSSGRRPPQRQ